MRMLRVAAVLLCAAVTASATAWQSAAEADAHFRAQEWDKAAAAYRKITAAQPKNGGAWHRLGYSLHISGKLEEALAAHLKAAELPQVRANGLYNAACASALLKRPDDAFRYLNEAIDAGMNNVPQLRNDSDLASLRSDPRWKKIVAKAGGATTGTNDSNDVRRAFDFWIGEWDVTNAAGTKVGVNVITARQNGAILYESWTSVNGTTGESLNFYDPKSKQWRQIWVTPTGVVSEAAGSVRDGAMHMTGTRTLADGTSVRTRSTYTPLDDGRVRQFIEHSTDDGTSWIVFFDGYYSRKDGAARKKSAAS